MYTSSPPSASVLYLSPLLSQSPPRVAASPARFFSGSLPPARRREGVPPTIRQSCRGPGRFVFHADSTCSGSDS
ncbi:hypothetical protein LX32DRAFT_637468 [Colletotrichum zoysiae]|uniref:Uncharacterized protein n=1 Tax=Colletotrichum zoysiae TaxID=1216348 RepID=A0AAD9HLE0_9PEZI|nr:hypothetical protein LX32DRAFT_637468 [Colletotrichum zoysiae]